MRSIFREVRLPSVTMRSGLTVRFQSNFTFLRAPNGEVVPYPIGIERPIRLPIVSVGRDTLKSFLPDSVPGGYLINKAKEIYLNVYRPQLMAWRRGAWVACSSDGELLVTKTQEEAIGLAYKYMQPADRSVDCYVCCVGSEFTVGICMDDITSSKAKEEKPVDDQGLYIPVEFSPERGVAYTAYSMKHGSGAELVGVPASVLSQYTLRRAVGEDVAICGPNGELSQCSMYCDLFFRLNGLVTKTDVVQLAGQRWLLGQPVYLRYRSVIDRTAPSILTMDPLPGEVDHE